MSRMTNQNLRRIKCIFEEKTHTDLNPAHKPTPKQPIRRGVLLAAILSICLLLAAFASPLFTPLNEDELTLSASYLGNGIISVYVENDSDKTLRFQEQLKLMYWGDGEEVIPLDGKVHFENTEFPPHSSGTMLVDLSGAYEVAALEATVPGKPAEAYYYLLLTNNDFLFGHDWMCSFHFVEDVPEENSTAEPDPEASLLMAQTLSDIEEALQFYFEDAYYDEIPAFNQANFDYLQKVQELLLRTEGTLIRPVDPAVYIDTSVAQVYDAQVPMDLQHQLIGQNYHAIDGYNRIIGSMFSGEDSDHALTLKALLPSQEGETDGGTMLPLLYFFVYERASLNVEQPYAFIYGQLLSFEALADHKVYEDERYVVYEVTDLFYTDLDAYIDYYLSVNKNIYCDEQIRQRVHNIYNFYKDKHTLSSLIVNLQEEAEQRGYIG